MFVLCSICDRRYYFHEDLVIGDPLNECYWCRTKQMHKDLDRLIESTDIMTRDTARMTRDVDRMTRDVDELSKDTKERIQIVDKMSRDLNRMTKDTYRRRCKRTKRYYDRILNESLLLREI